MLNFLYDIPTKILFGRGQIAGLAEETKKYSQCILIVTGRGSVKKYGIYERARELLTKEGITCFELADIKPNPVLNKAYEGIELCR
ncbi:MAG: iron-containing alcohol dehydrogenase, partial [Candidatus Omnitrophota bacterium]|nr:iron-containing alcohol dehydrogenase [Candidatus Omnitrophota bacterium]